MTVRFSVCIPVWNDSEWLPGAIESILAQSHQDWELFIGDNASDEDLQSIVNQFADPRIHYQRWPRHTGLFENHNRVAQLATSEWVDIMSADDRLEPGCLAAVASRIEQAGPTVDRLAAVLTACTRVAPDGKPGDRAFYGHSRMNKLADGIYSPAEWLAALCVPGQLAWNLSSAAFSRDVLSESGWFRPDVGLAGDVELVLRVAAYGSVAFIDENLMRYTVRGDSVTSGHVRRNLERGDPYTDYGAAFIYAMRAHYLIRGISEAEQGQANDVIARSHVQRALQQRLSPGGRGRIGALNDMIRAFKFHPRLLLSPLHVGLGFLTVLAPKSLLAWALQLGASLRGR